MAKHKKKTRTLIATVKALNIAIIVLAAISILVSITALIYCFVAIYVANTSGAINEIANNTQMAQQTYIDGENLIVGQSRTSLVDLANIGLGFMLGFSIMCLLSACFSLFVAIWTIIKNKISKPPKSCFTLNIASCICSLLTASFIRVIVLIISCLFLYKINKKLKSNI